MKQVYDITDPKIGFNNKANNKYSLRNDDFVTHQKTE